jgi:serine/threonine protein kinase
MVNGSGHDHAIDIWALGVFFYELLVGKTPFVEKIRHDTNSDTDVDTLEQMARAKTYHNIVSYTGNLEIPDGSPQAVSIDSLRLIRTLIDPNPKTRIRCKELLEKIIEIESL